jgi:uncharacterized protein (DUF1697 family)
MRWVAFLRAVNVGGRQVSMPLVRSLLTDEGFDDVGTYIASGNVFVTTRARMQRTELESNIEQILARQFDFAVPTMARTLDELDEVLSSSGFPSAKPEGDLRRLVLFAKDAVSIPRLPYELPKAAGTIVGTTERDLFVEMHVGDRVPNPASVVEKDLGAVVTGRFGHTLHKIVAAARTEGAAGKS